jgi:hypothetical protein
MQSCNSAPVHELPAWTDNGPLIERHPELHHYTTREGLAGIWKNNTLWATHFSHLSDSSEIVLVRNPLVAALEVPIKRQIMSKQHESFRTRRFVEKQGGVDAVTKSLARDFVESFVKTAFTGGKHPPIAEPFICSFCSHANDHQYEQANGLLSQWRGYGRKGDGRFALVFDTQELDNLLVRERRAHSWVKLDLAEVVYLNGPATLETLFPELLQEALAFISVMLEGSREPHDNFLTPFFQAATVLKHRGFQEEREVRIVAILESKQVLADFGKENDLADWPPVKDVRALGESKKYVALFESLDAEFPIKRIIVGPGANQRDDIEFANSLVSDRVSISISETPFIG